MGSPFRHGAAGGVVAEQTIWDFGRTSSQVKKARYEVEYNKEDTQVTVYQVKRLSLETFYECSKFKSLRDIWSNLAGRSGIITDEAHKNLLKPANDLL